MTLSICSDLSDEVSSRILIHNVYNESVIWSSSMIESLSQILSEQSYEIKEDDHLKHIILEDFNIHHSQWEGDSVLSDHQSEALLNLADEY